MVRVRVTARRRTPKECPDPWGCARGGECPVCDSEETAKRKRASRRTQTARERAEALARDLFTRGGRDQQRATRLVLEGDGCHGAGWSERAVADRIEIGLLVAEGDARREEREAFASVVSEALVTWRIVPGVERFARRVLRAIRARGRARKGAR